MRTHSCSPETVCVTPTGQPLQMGILINRLLKAQVVSIHFSILRARLLGLLVHVSSLLPVPSAQTLVSHLGYSSSLLASFLPSPVPLSASSHDYHANTIPFSLEKLSAYSALPHFHCLTGESQAPQCAQRALPIGSCSPFLLVDRPLTFLPLCLSTHCASSLEAFPCLVHLVYQLLFILQNPAQSLLS